jgi:hypothetical protein
MLVTSDTMQREKYFKKVAGGEDDQHFLNLLGVFRLFWFSSRPSRIFFALFAVKSF